MTDAEANALSLELLSNPASSYRDLPNDPGFWTSFRGGLGSSLGGIGEAVGKFTGNQDNWLARIADDIEYANPSSINSWADAGNDPWQAAKETAGNLTSFMVPYTGAAKLLQAARAGAAVTGLTQAAVAGLPAYGSIGDAMRANNVENDVVQLGAAMTIGGVERFGAQRFLGKALTPGATRSAAAREFMESPLKEAAKVWGKTGLEEGLEEIVQNPIEQWAGGNPVTTPEAIDETLFQGGMGALAGLMLGPLGAGANYRQASKLTRQIDSAREMLATPMTSPDQIPEYQAAQDFLTKVTGNDFGLPAAQQQAAEQGQAMQQNRDTMLEQVAEQKYAAETATAMDAQSAQQAEAQKQLAESQKVLMAERDKQAKEQQKLDDKQEKSDLAIIEAGTEAQAMFAEQETKKGPSSNIAVQKAGEEWQKAFGMGPFTGSLVQQQADLERIGAVNSQLRDQRLAEMGQVWQDSGAPQQMQDEADARQEASDVAIMLAGADAQALGPKLDAQQLRQQEASDMAIVTAGAAAQDLGIPKLGRVSPNVVAAVAEALSSGAITQAQHDTLLSDLKTAAGTPVEVRDALDDLKAAMQPAPIPVSQPVTQGAPDVQLPITQKSPKARQARQETDAVPGGQSVVAQQAEEVEEVARSADTIFAEVKALKDESLGLLSKDGKRPSAPAKRAQWDALQEEITSKTAEWAAADAVERKAKKTALKTKVTDTPLDLSAKPASTPVAGDLFQFAGQTPNIKTARANIAKSADLNPLQKAQANAGLRDGSLLPEDFEQPTETLDEAQAPRGQKASKRVDPAQEPGQVTITTGAAAQALVDQSTPAREIDAASADYNARVDAQVAAEDRFARLAPSESKEPLTGKLKFRTVPKNKGMKKADVEKLVNSIKDDWTNAPDLEVVQSESELPQDMQDQITAEKGEGKHPGAYWGGTVYMIADNISGAHETYLTLAHEATGHFGLQGLLGAAFKPVMRQIYRDNATIRAAADAKMKADKTLSQEVATEEVLADMQETAIPGSALKTLYRAIRAALLRIFRGQVFTDIEIDLLLSQARIFVKSGVKQADGSIKMPFRARFSGASSPVWYSALTKGIQSAVSGSMPASAWGEYIKSMVNKGTVKADEVEWSGLTEFLALQEGKVTKEQVTEFLDANGVQVTETVLGGVKRDATLEKKINNLENKIAEADQKSSDAWFAYVVSIDTTVEGAPRTQKQKALRAAYGVLDAEKRILDDELLTLIETQLIGATKFGRYQLPGGTNYREVLLTLPVSSTAAAAALEVAIKPLRHKYGSGVISRFSETERAAIQPLVDAARAEDARRTPTFRQGHFHNTPNVLAHIRLNDRVDANGKKVLFVEEIQSDWGQAGKKEGFVGTAQGAAKANSMTDEEFAALSPDDQRFAIDETRNSSSVSTPRAPFVTNTDKWVALAIKRIIKLAVDEGYDSVAFINGEQSADRYDLSKQVDVLSMQKRTMGGGYIISATKDDKELISHTVADEAAAAEFVGKEPAARLFKEIANPRNGGIAELTGLNLKVGGEGMKAFYDKIVPSVLKKVTRKLGGEGLTTVELSDTDPRGKGRTIRSTNIFGSQETTKVDDEPGLSQTGFTITPAMKENAAGGMALFRTFDRAFYRWFGDSKVVDADGKPLVVYHGTVEDFSTFDPDALEVSGGMLGKGFYFARADQAGAFTDGVGANVMPVYLRLVNPLVGEITSKDVELLRRTMPEFDEAYAKALETDINPEDRAQYKPSIERLGVISGDRNNFIQKALVAAGYDGRIVGDLNTDSDMEILVFNPNQIKSATGNIGTYDPSNNDIRFRTKKPSSASAEPDSDPDSGQTIPDDLPPYLLTGGLKEIARNIVSLNWRARPGLLGWVSNDQLAERFKAIPAVRSFAKAMNAMAARTSEIMGSSDKLKREWDQHARVHGDHIDMKFARLLLQSTRSHIWPNQELSHESQKHLDRVDLEVQAEHTSLSTTFKSLPSAYQQLFAKLTKDFDMKHAAKVAAMRTDIINSYRSEDGRGLSDKVLREAGTIKPAEQDAFMEEHGQSKSDVDTLRKLWADLREHATEFDNKLQGPYFPLMRFGDHVISYKSPAMAKAIQALIDAKELLQTAYHDDNYSAVTSVESSLARLQSTLKRSKSPSARAKLQSDITKTKVELKALMGPLDALRKTVSVAQTRVDNMKGSDKHHGVEFFETLSAATARRAQLDKRFSGLDISVTQGTKDKYLQQLDATSPAFMHRLSKKLSENVPQAQASKMRQAMRELYYQMSPDTSALKSQIKRLNVPGVKSSEVRRAYAASSMRDAWAIGRMEFKGDMAEALNSLRFDRDDADAKMVGNELAQRVAMNMTYSDTPLLNVLSSLTYMQYLGLSPSFLITNATQPWLISAPIMASRHGFGIIKDLGTATRQAGQMLKASHAQLEKVKGGLRTWIFTLDIDASVKANVITAEEGVMLKRQSAEGRLEITIRHDLGVASQGENPGWLGKLVGMASVPAQQIEVINRVATALAAYRAELAKATKEGASNPTEQAHMYAAKIVGETHLNYAAENKGRFMHPNSWGGWGKIAFQFKAYQQGMLYLVIKNMIDASRGDKEAMRATIYLSGTMLAAAGTSGLPGAAAAAFVAQLIYQGLTDDDDEKDLKELMMVTLRSTGGDTFANLVMKGAPAAFLNWDISKRVGMGDIASPLPFVDDNKEGRDMVPAYWIAATGGAGLSMLTNWAEAVKKAGEGKYTDALRFAAPKVLSDLVKAKVLATDGLVDSRGNNYLKESDVSGGDIIFKVLGYNTTALSNLSETRRAYMDARQNIKDVRGRLLSQAIKDRASVAEDISEFNERNPGHKITGSTIEQSRRAKKRYEDSIRNGVPVGKNDRALAEELGIL